MTIYKYVPHVSYNVHFSSGRIDLPKHEVYINETEYFQSLLPDIFSDYDIVRGVDQGVLPNDLFLKLMHSKPSLKE